MLLINKIDTVTHTMLNIAHAISLPSMKELNGQYYNWVCDCTLNLFMCISVFKNYSYKYYINLISVPAFCII